MKRFKLTLALIFIVEMTIAVHKVAAQGQVDTSGSRIFYRNEMTGGISLNSNGFGFGYRYAKRINYLNKKVFESDFSWLKHPKEEKINNPGYPNGRSFVFGKLNNFYTLRIGGGRQRELFSKADVGSIAIRIIGTAGVSLGIQKPCYYEVIENDIIQTRKFDKNKDKPETIYQRASFFRGIDETSVVPGAYLKTALSFEYSRQEEILHIIEGGFMVEAFPKKIPIMALTENNQFFVSIYISYRFGKIIDPQLQALQRQQRKEAME